jgi:two-component system, LuxR family, response regulator FixJ
VSPKRTAPADAAQPSPKGAWRTDHTTIFLVDEDDAVRDALAMSLRAAGHPVAAFNSGRQFLAAYQREDPGCLVVDMDLADMGAAELLRTLAAAQPALPAIITSRRLKRRSPVGGLPPGRILLLDKPFGIDELLRLIRIALAPAPGSQPGS